MIIISVRHFKMNSLARALAILLAVVLVDALVGFRVYRKLVHSAAGVYCKLTNRRQWERTRCTERVFYSSTLWLVIAIAAGLAGGYVTLQALATQRW